MNDEIRFVTREETFNDLAVRELAKGKAACICRLQFKRCDERECRNCSAAKKFNNCVNQMSDYDRLRLDSYIAEFYTQYSSTPDQWMSYKGYITYYLKFTLMMFVVVSFLFAFLVFCIKAPCDSPRTLSPTIRDNIITTVMEAQKSVYDHNKDGLVNCIDYTCLFKETWDKRFPEMQTNCVIVRNVNPLSGMNHLFIRIYADGLVNDVEPWASAPWRFEMESNWGKKYNPDFNFYGETRRWLSDMAR